MVSRLEGRVAVVTGAVGAIGTATARRLSTEGAAIVAVDLNAAGLDLLVDSLPGPAVAVTADISTEAGVRAYLDKGVQVFGRVDLHHLNAGITGSLAPLVDVDLEEWDRVMAVNLRGSFIGVREAFRHLFAHDSAGAIVVTGSISSLTGASDLIAYTASKHGLLGLVRGAAIYGGPAGIRVNAVAPGVIPSAIHGEQGTEDMVRRGGTTPLRRSGTPEDVAAAVAFLLSDDAAYITGEVISMDGGASVVHTARAAGGAGAWDTGPIDDALARDKSAFYPITKR